MRQNKFSLDEILNNDPLGILDYKKRDPVKNNDQRLVDSFHEINHFYESNMRIPEKVSDIMERDLYSRLKGIRENPDKVFLLKEYDKYDLLENIEEVVRVDSIDDIFNNDPLGVLGNSGVDIFSLKNVPEIKKDRADADFVARREVCHNFEKYEDVFKNTQKDLENGKRILVESVESELREGSFCLLDGVLLLIVKIYDPIRGNSEKLNRRTEIVFENATKSNMLLRSLGKRLKDAGKMVTELTSNLNLKSDFSESDIESGYIYILKSLSKDDRILTMKNLYKIGFSSGDVKERIKNAEKDPTYLMAPVAIVTSFKVVNMNPHKLEQLLHKFFGVSRLNIDMIGPDGMVHSPREWFIAPLNVIETVIEMIVNGSILNYRYDNIKEEICLKSS